MLPKSPISPSPSRRCSSMPLTRTSSAPIPPPKIVEPLTLSPKTALPVEEDEEKRPKTVPFPTRRPRLPSWPLPAVPRPGSDHPYPPTSMLFPPSPSSSSSSPSSSTFLIPSSNQMSTKRGSNAANPLLRSHPSFQALMTPTPTTPNIIERTWTQKISIWPLAMVDRRPIRKGGAWGCCCCCSFEEGESGVEFGAGGCIICAYRYF